MSEAEFSRARRGSTAMVVAALGAACAAQALAAEALPPDIVSAIRKDYVMEGTPTRYVDGHVDLDGDGKDEWLVYVVGSMACGTGGCPTLVFTPAGSGYRLVSTIGLTRPPIRVASGSSKGWHNLVVHVSGGGQRGRDVELLFDGRRYPSNPGAWSSRIKPATSNARTVIAEFAGFDAATPLP